MSRSTIVGRSTLLVVAVLPCLVSALGLQQQPHPTPTFLRRDLVTLEGCPENKELVTPYNENNDSYLLSGIMFTVRTISSALSITTFELDIRTDVAGTDLAIEVYTLLNGYTDAFNIESSWTLVANTEVVPVPGSTTNSVLIPVQDFEKIFMSVNELRSFYITMRNPYIESTVNAMVDSGETAIENEVLKIDVGSGLATYKFPATFDTLTAPQFAGIIHYEIDTEEACLDSTTETKFSIEYKFLVNASGLDPTVISNFNNETKSFFDGQMDDESGYLREYKLKYQLTQLTDPTSTATERPMDVCQSDFTSCSEIVVSASFEHSDGILNDNMLYLLYTMVDSFRGQLKRGLDTTVLYIGKQARSATFTFTFDGVPSATMSTGQVEYFQEFTKSFTTNAVSESIHEIVVQKQEIVDGSLVVTGQFLGTDAGGEVAPQAFTDNIANALRSKNNEYVVGLAYNVLRPTSRLDKVDAGYFQDITSFQLDMQAIIQTLAPTPVPVADGAVAPTADGVGNTIDDLTKAASDADGSMLVIIAVIGVICVCIVVLVLYICCRCSRKDVLDFDKNQTSTYPDLDDDDDDDDDASFEKKKSAADSSSETSLEKKPSMSRSVSSRQPSSLSLGKNPPKPVSGLQRGQSMSVINQKSGPPKLGRSKSGDALPLPTRNVDFKKSKSSDGLSSNSRLPSLSEEERPKRRPPSSGEAGAPLSRSNSGDSIQRPTSTPVPNIQRSISADVTPRPIPSVSPSPTSNEGQNMTPTRAPPKRENSQGGMRPPRSSISDSALDKNDSGNVAAMSTFSPTARVSPMRAQSMNPNAAVRNNSLGPLGSPPPRPKPSEQMPSFRSPSSGSPNHRPAPPQRAPYLQVHRAGNTNGPPPSTPQRQQQPQRPMPPARAPSQRRPEAGSNNGPSMAPVVPSTPKRDPEMLGVTRTPSNGATTRQMSPHQQQQQHPQSRPNTPQRTISLPVNSKNVPPHRPMATPPTKTKMDFGDRTTSSDVHMSSPMRTKSMPIKPTNQHPGNGNPTNAVKPLSPIT